MTSLALPQCARPARPASSQQLGSAVRQPSEASVAVLKAEFPDARVYAEAAGQLRITGLKPRFEMLDTTPEETARQILARPSVARLLGLSQDLHELCNPLTRGDTTHAIVRMEQCVSGVRVLGAEIVLTVRTRPATVDDLTSSLSPHVRIDSGLPRIDAASAARAAARALEELSSNPRMKGRIRPSALKPSPEPVYFEPARFGLVGDSRLCWSVERDGLQFLIDARTGAVAHQFERVLR
jgi:hypothetical protein